MSFALHPWQFYLVILSGWMNQQQQEVIADGDISHRGDPTHQ